MTARSSAAVLQARTARISSRSRIVMVAGGGGAGEEEAEEEEERTCPCVLAGLFVWSVEGGGVGRWGVGVRTDDDDDSDGCRVVALLCSCSLAWRVCSPAC